MHASVIVCTRNRADSIGETLAAVSKLESPDFEVLVVDSSTELEREKTAQCARQYGAKYLLEPRRGLNIARNTGIANAAGDIVAFTDDDCIPEKPWLAQKLQNFSDASVWACTGRVVQHSREGASDLFEEVAGQDLGAERRVFSQADVHMGIAFFLGNLAKVFAKHMKSSAPVPYCIGHGSSMAFRKNIFPRIRTFDDRFGNGAPLGGCDDIEMFYRILRSGGRIVYEPTAVVRHKHRFAAQDVFQTRYGYSFGNATFMRVYRRDLRMFVLFYGRLLQLVLKSTQYRLTGNKDLAQSFKSDLRGFLDGWATYRRLPRGGSLQASKPDLAPKAEAR